MATVSSIGTSSRNYSTIAAWIAAFASGGWEGQCYKDTEFVLTSGFALNGTSGTNYIKLTAAAGQSMFDNPFNKLTYDASNGVGIRTATNYIVPFVEMDAYATISRLAIWNDGQGNDARAVEAAVFNTTVAAVIDKCLIIASNNNSSYASGSLRLGGNGTNLMTNSVVVANNANNPAILMPYGNNSTIVNCTIVSPSNKSNGSYGIYDNSGTDAVHVYNTAIFGFAGGSSGGATGQSDHFIGTNNATDLTQLGSGTWAPSSSLTSQSYAGMFNNPSTSVSMATADWRLKSGSSLIDAGSDQHSTYAAVATDMYGTARPQSTSYDIGAQEYIALPVSYFNPADKASAITLSNLNLTATQATTVPSNGDDCVRVNVSQSSGLRTFSVTIGNTTGSDTVGVGISTAAFSLVTFLGSDQESFGWFGDGTLNFNSAIPATIGGFTTGDVLHVAIDLAGKKFYGKVNSGNWNNSGTADPVAGTGGISFSSLHAGPYFPTLNMEKATENATYSGTDTGGLSPPALAWDTTVNNYTLTASKGTLVISGKTANLTPSRVTTRLYLQNATAGYTPTTLRGAWDVTTSSVTTGLSKTKSGASTTVAIAETSTTNNWDGLLGRFVSDPFTAPASILATNTLAWIAMVTESNASANDFFHVHAYVTTGDSDTPRGTILTDNIGATEWTTTNTGRGEGAKTLSALSVQRGDRLVAEIGYQAQNTSATSFTATLRYGGTGADATQGGTTTSTVGYVEFTSNGDPYGEPVLAGGQGSLGVTGQSANLVHGYVLSAGQGTLSITGQAATLTRASGGARTLTAAPGAFSETGEAVLLLIGHRLVAGQGALALTGEAAVLFFGHKLVTAQGAFGETGELVSLRAARQLATGNGNFALTGETAVLTYAPLGGPAHTLTAAAGSFSGTGESANLLEGRRASATNGGFALSGKIAVLVRGRTLLAVAGSCGLTGEAAILTAIRRLGAVNGLFTLGGVAAALNRGRAPLLAGAGAFAWMGRAAALSRLVKLLTGAGSFRLSGENARLRVIGWASSPATPASWNPDAPEFQAWTDVPAAAAGWSPPNDDETIWAPQTGSSSTWN